MQSGYVSCRYSSRQLWGAIKNEDYELIAQGWLREESSDIGGYKLKWDHCGTQLRVPLVTLGSTFLRSIWAVSHSLVDDDHHMRPVILPANRVQHISLAGVVWLIHSGESGTRLSPEALLAVLFEECCPQLIRGRGSWISPMERWGLVSSRYQLPVCNMHISIGALWVLPAS